MQFIALRIDPPTQIVSLSFKISVSIVNKIRNIYLKSNKGKRKTNANSHASETYDRTYHYSKISTKNHLWFVK